MTRVKICGITNEEDMDICITEGADALGFVVNYPVPVPWNLTIDEAKELMKKVPPFVSKVAVVGDSIKTVIDIAKILKPDVIQLHGNESFDTTKKIISEVKSFGIKVIKAVRFSIETGKPLSKIEDPIGLCYLYKNMGVDALVLDSATKSMPAGTGMTFSWKIAAEIRDSLDIPVILAGGLTPKNVYKAIVMVKPFAVDVITGVEKNKGKKDPRKVKLFIKEAKRYE